MLTASDADVIREIFWESLEGSPLNLQKLRDRMLIEQEFQRLGLDSLDLVEFFLRVQERFKIAIRQEDYAELVSIDAVVQYVRSSRAAS